MEAEASKSLSARERGRAACRKWYAKNAEKERQRKRAYMEQRRGDVPGLIKEQKTRSYWNTRDTALPKKRERSREPESRAKQEKWKRRNHVKVMWMNAKHRALRAGLEFTITPDDISVPSHCPVLGIPLIPGVGKTTANSPSIDRFDNSRGYTPDNIRIISCRANSLKSDANVDELEAVAQYMRGG